MHITYFKVSRSIEVYLYLHYQRGCYKFVFMNDSLPGFVCPPLCMDANVLASLKNRRNVSVSTTWEFVQFFRCFFPFSNSLVLFNGPCFNINMFTLPICKNNKKLIVISSVKSPNKICLYLKRFQMVDARSVSPAGFQFLWKIRLYRKNTKYERQNGSE